MKLVNRSAGEERGSEKTREREKEKERGRHTCIHIRRNSGDFAAIMLHRFDQSFRTFVRIPRDENIDNPHKINLIKKKKKLEFLRISYPPLIP